VHATYRHSVTTPARSEGGGGRAVLVQGVRARRELSLGVGARRSHPPPHDHLCSTPRSGRERRRNLDGTRSKHTSAFLHNLLSLQNPSAFRAVHPQGTLVLDFHQLNKLELALVDTQDTTTAQGGDGVKSITPTHSIAAIWVQGRVEPSSHPPTGSLQLPHRPWSDNPNAPKIPYDLYFEEKANFAGILIGSILYGTRKAPPPTRPSIRAHLFVRFILGILIVLFFQCMAALFNPANRRREGIKWGLVSYTVVMFSFVTVFTAMNLNIQSISYIDNREFPGVEGVLPPWTTWIPVVHLLQGAQYYSPLLCSS
jgi:hypothetical protein